ncbi:Protein-associating with the carboxyl-terminal domain of ezrin [Bienertia sinuspersici]
MSPINQEVENSQNQKHCFEHADQCNEEERELEEALSLSDLPINAIISEDNQQSGGIKEDTQNARDNLETEFDFGSLVGSVSPLDGEMCTADEVFSGGQILPYRNSVSSMSGLRSVSRSGSMDCRGFGSRSSSSRSSSIRSHYSNSSSGSSCSSSNNTTISSKTVPLLSNTKVQNQFHSYPSPKPQILGSSMRVATCTTPVGKKSKMWEVLKMGLVRTPEIELQDLKLRHRSNNYGKNVAIPRNNSIGSSGSSNSIKASTNQNIDSARKSWSNDGNRINDFVLEIQKRRNNQLAQNKNDNSGFFKSCKCSIGAIEPMPSIRSNSVNFGKSQNISSPKNQALNEDKNVTQKKNQVAEEQKHQQKQRRNNNLRQGKKVMSHHHHHRRTFEWLKNLSHASVLNNS